MLQHFNKQELLMVDEAVKAAEELVNNYFKMSSSQWLKNKYDIKTAKDLASHECVSGPFAQVIKYEGQKKDASLCSSTYSLYKICLQDNAILLSVKKNKTLLLKPFLLYILTHELVHIVRFLRFKQRYENTNEADVTLDEEHKVHEITYSILKFVSVSGLNNVFEFYEDWLRGF